MPRAITAPPSTTSPPEEAIEAVCERATVFAAAARAVPEDDAKAWVERYCTADIYEQIWDAEDA